ncbi:MAG TPA: pyridoxal phosphate-dependent aminotransferase [Bacteroidota bacterium]|nr:pyridoxal phosphate-dependent aminotransferase [Bacteroidota bacterium]
MFSSRTEWPLSANRLSLLLEERRKQGKPVLDLTVSNPTDVGLEYPSQEILSALSKPEVLSYRPHPLGALHAREAVAAYYRARGVRLPADRIVLTASTSEAYGWLFMLLCEARDSVLVPIPSYPLFEHLARLHDVELRPYHLRYDGAWHIDFESVNQALTERTRACIVVTPHNPTGVFLKKAELEQLNAVAGERGFALIVDEVFGDYAFGEDEDRVVTTATNEAALTFTLNGVSKSCGFPQMKVGWIVVSGPSALRHEALQRIEMIADTFLSVSTQVQEALADFLRIGESIRAQILRRVKENYMHLRDKLGASAVSVLVAEGGWYAVLRVPRTVSDEEWAVRLLADAGVYVFPGFFFDFPDSGFLIVSLLTKPDDLSRGVEAILALVTS